MRDRRRSSQEPLVGARVLVVEDDPASRKLLSLILTGAGALVSSAGSAEEALALLAADTPDTPDAIVVDLVLPRMGGLLFVERVKADARTAHCVVIAATSLNGRDAERAALDAGCAAFVRKPIDTETFPAIVEYHLRGS